VVRGAINDGLPWLAFDMPHVKLPGSQQTALRRLRDGVDRDDTITIGRHIMYFGDIVRQHHDAQGMRDQGVGTQARRAKGR
jgi:hypothetical protein